VFRWLHLFFGILWIGLLYYLNFVQVPTMPAIPAELKKGVTGFIAPKVFFFFRWAALLTVVTGSRKFKGRSGDCRGDLHLAPQLDHAVGGQAEEFHRARRVAHHPGEQLLAPDRHARLVRRSAASGARGRSWSASCRTAAADLELASAPSGTSVSSMKP
jgi:hypothetical protein